MPPPKDWQSLRDRFRALDGELWRTHADDGPRYYVASAVGCDWVIGTIVGVRLLIGRLERDCVGADGFRKP